MFWQIGAPDRTQSPRSGPWTRNFRMAFFSGRPFPSGSFCHKREHAASLLCLTFSGSLGYRGQRPLPPLGNLGQTLPFSPILNNGRGGGSFTTLQWKGILVAPLYAQSSWFPSLLLRSPNPISLPLGHSLCADDQQRPGVSSQPIHFQSSRVETMRLALRVSGYSDAAINILLLAHKPGTTKQYQAVWTKFCAFLSMSRLTSKDVSVGVVCEFLAYHSRVYKRKYRTLATYKSALRHPVLFSCNVEINCISFELFMRGLFNLAPPSRAKEKASWSLNDLLLFLLTSQFEPLESATLCSTLILLASGRRIGEIANLTRNYEEIVSPPSISLIWATEFVPKHHTPTFQSCYPSIDYLNSKVASPCPCLQSFTGQVSCLVEGCSST
ncbi:unnamed protein product [Meganyctiphanes norvegica]|uniref:Uncharacterized protein n=1 Tax=Meganyctiphanes norvegica TaxID=48144 RepID=A0AAV2SIF4_MEGNR